MDYTLFQFINQFAGRVALLDSLAVFFAAYFQYILAGVLLIYLLIGKEPAEKNKNRLMIGLAFLAAFVSRFGVGEIIKRLIDRARPFEIHQVTQLIPYDAGRSFPSGHMLFFFAMSAVVYSFNKKLGLIFFAGSFLTGLARIFVGIHYPLDILGGGVIGILIGWLGVKIFRKYRQI